MALLIRRCRQAFGGQDIICVGTSATMASGGTHGGPEAGSCEGRADAVRCRHSTPTQVIGETLGAGHAGARSGRSGSLGRHLRLRWPSDDAAAGGLRGVPDASAGVLDRVHLRRARGAGHRTAGAAGAAIACVGDDGAAEELATLTGCCVRGLRSAAAAVPDEGVGALSAARRAGFPIFAFRLHQFFTRGDTVWATIEPEAERHLEMAKKGSKPGEPDKPLFPLVFCRHCGSRLLPGQRRARTSTAHSATPREDRREEGDDGQRGRLPLSVGVGALAARRRARTCSSACRTS